MANSSRDGNIRPPDLPLEKSVFGTGSNSYNWTWNKTGFKSEEEYIKAIYCHPAYLTYMQSTMRNAGLDEAQVGIKISGRSINNFRYADDTTVMAESKEEEPLDESERGE